MIFEKNRVLLKRVGVVLLAVSLVGCGSFKKSESDSGRTLDARLAEASDVQVSGQAEKAIELYKAASVKFPADKRPWLRMAQLKFDAASYAESILYAQEALQRDSSDKVANSIVAVAGLRVSTNALAELRKLNNLSGSVRTEAQDLARVLREYLGEPVLLPPTGVSVGHSAATPLVVAPTPTRSVPSRRSSAAAQQRQSPPKPVAEGGSPFGGLQ